MTRPLASALIPALAFAALLASAKEARACSCVPPPPPNTALERAASVFVGEVVSVTASGQQKKVRLTVDERFKGEGDELVTLLTPAESAACGRNFVKGTRYLVYAEEVEGVLHDHLCSRTTPIEQAKDDLEALAAVARGEEPHKEPAPSVEDGKETPPSGAASDDTQALDEVPPVARAPEPAKPPPPSDDVRSGNCNAAGGAPLLPIAAFGLLVLCRRRRRS